MVQAQQQFTPRQILEAGQRAVAEGRTDYARQFFQHLIVGGVEISRIAHDRFRNVIAYDILFKVPELIEFALVFRYGD